MELDEPKSVQRVLKSLVKKHNKNMEDRLKYAQTPEKFYDSEMELMVLIEGMKGGTESAALYEGLIGDASDGGEAVGVMMGLSQVRVFLVVLPAASSFLTERPARDGTLTLTCRFSHLMCVAA